MVNIRRYLNITTAIAMSVALTACGMNKTEGDRAYLKKGAKEAEANGVTAPTGFIPSPGTEQQDGSEPDTETANVVDVSMDGDTSGTGTTDTGADASSALTGAFPDSYMLRGDVPGGQLEIATSGQDFFIKLIKADGSGQAGAWFLGDDVYMMQDNNGTIEARKTTKQEIEADPSITMSDIDMMGELKEAISDPSKGATTIGETNMNGEDLTMIEVPDKDGGAPTTVYVSKETGICRYIELPNESGDGSTTLFSMEESGPVAHEAWMDNATAMTPSEFMEGMFGIIMMAFIGDNSINTSTSDMPTQDMQNTTDTTTMPESDTSTPADGSGTDTDNTEDDGLDSIEITGA